MNDAVLGTPDPSARLVAAFRDIHRSRMIGLPFLNPTLDVEAVAFAPWEARWLGVMITPWFMNLTLVPGDPARWLHVPPGGKRTYRFPAGAYEFIGAHDPAIGEYQLCSLFSPMEQFEGQPVARLVATLAREALFDAENAESPDRPRAEAAQVEGPIARLQTELQAPLSKRDFLRGRFVAGGRHDDRG